ncbi:Ser-Thr-rich GPI-anchored membrane family protein [Streptomyces sp. KL116D]|uniref:Ser-Thr-rich GPI-anchored membrane family protein n=1 Tax=Streptomyces sp. KL116D TaxID=3045152 RepID=UPI0035568C2D
MRRTGFLSPLLALAAAPLLAFAPAAGPDPGLSVTAPAAGSVHQAGGTVFVTWQNSTGQEVDMWLVRGGTARVVQLAAKLGDAPTGETATVLPPLPEGGGYAIELASRDGSARGYSPSFSVGPDARLPGPPPAASPGSTPTTRPAPAAPAPAPATAVQPPAPQAAAPITDPSAIRSRRTAP